MSDLKVNIGNLTLKNPVLTASGTFGYGEEFSSFFDINDLGGIITKTITLKPRVGNPFPRIAETPSGMLNSIGLANVGVDAFISEKMPFLKTLNTAVIVNVAGNTVEEYVELISKLEDSDAEFDGYEINVSCPNVKEGGVLFGSNYNITAEITRKIRKATQRCVIIKLTPNVTSIGDVAAAVEQAGADSVSLINTLIGMAIDVDTRRPKIACITGGLSGPAIKPVALAKVFEVSKRVNIPIIGIGGIMNYQDALEFMMAGATAIEVGTANFIDPAISSTIVANLHNYCISHNIRHVREIVSSIIA
ncbi:dihydroorotate dehydrogenase [candidate division KSB1 bacterium]|nr:dihydroorotate dehydrogenase [candidate division KSB1 bacterium]